MKNNDLHKTLTALDIRPVKMLAGQQALKNALSNYSAPKQTLASRFRSACTNLTGVFMSHKKTFMGASTLTVAMVLALSIVTFNYTHSPRAEAEQLVTMGLDAVQTFSSGQMGQIQAQLGDDPAKALEEAQAAKDLTVLTDEQYKAEFANHPGVATSSLGKDGAQYSSVGISVNGGGLPVGDPTNTTNQRFSTTGEGVDKGSTSISTRTEIGVSTGNEPLRTFQTNNDSEPSGPDHSAAPVQIPLPSKYLRYTNSTGHVVVLGLNDKGVPIMKTVFMTDDEVHNLQQNSPKPSP